MKILVTGFEPFGGEPVNPAAEAVSRLPGRIAGAQLRTLIVPTAFDTCVPRVVEVLEADDIDAVLCVGQAGGRGVVTPERVAINIDDARIPDNAGRQPLDEAIVVDGPAAYFTTVPNKAIVQAIRAAGIPAELSNTAGTFVCNHLIYGVLHHLAETGRRDLRAGFVHVPFIPEQVRDRPGTPALPLDRLVVALSAAIEAIVTHPVDIELSAGQLH